METIKTALQGARWFSAVGRYGARPGQLALPSLAAWERAAPSGHVAAQQARIAASMDWLPSSRDQPDPVHGESLMRLLKAGEISYHQEVMTNYKLALHALRAVPDRSICSGPHDFTPAAIGAALYCVRMASLEMLAGRSGFWLAALEIYRAGHWPCGLLPDGTLVVY